MMFVQRTPTRTGLDAARSGVSPTVNSAVEMSHERLAEFGIPHVLVGGIAVGVHGHQYATQDVDCLVPRAAATFFPQSGCVCSSRSVREGIEAARFCPLPSPTALALTRSIPSSVAGLPLEV